MELSGEQQFGSTRDVVWGILFRPEILEECIPGAQTVTRSSETEYEGTVQRGLASITVEMDVRVEIVEDDRPNGVTCRIQGTDNRINSDVDGTATITIQDTADGGSTLTYQANLNFTGRLVSLGSRMIKRQMNNDLKAFFSSVEEQIETTTAD